MIFDLAAASLVLVGGAFMLLAGVGVLRMPDLFTRMQAATKGATLGAGCLLLAVAVHFRHLDVGARAVLVIVFVFLTAPVAAHLIARAAYAVGVPLWEGTLRDELKQARAAAALPADAGSSGDGTAVPQDGAIEQRAPVSPSEPEA